MSSSPPTDRAVRRRGPAGWSLRTRLLVAVVVLVAAVCAVIGVATTLAVYHLQVGRLDAQLYPAANRTRQYGDPHQPSDDDDRHRLPPLEPLPEGPDSIATHLESGGHVEKVFEPAAGGWQPLSAAQVTALHSVRADGQPHTVDVPHLGTYRVLGAAGQDGQPIYTGLPMADVLATRDWLIVLEISIGLGAALLAGLIGAFVIRSNLRPLRRVAATASRVAELPLDRGEVALSVRVPDEDTDPRTEVGQVGAALNRMLGHVAGALAARQASEMRVRHFLADASHELRTPLAAIRGYAELTRRVSTEVPPDVAHAMRRVESETGRMTTLVEDMLLLARLDSGRPLERETVDLSRLVIDAVSDAHVAAPEHRWRLDLPPDSVTVTGDPARLHQVLANLLANARTHTPPGTFVTVRLTADPVVVTVEDDGPGIPPDLLPEVFDRFARGDTSRSRAAGSTGLGLAIVAAVVEAHHGTVEVTSEPGRTVVTVRLPAAQPGLDDRADGQQRDDRHHLPT
jgi:two-component system OmpR family sensor kinase